MTNVIEVNPTAAANLSSRMDALIADKDALLEVVNTPEEDRDEDIVEAAKEAIIDINVKLKALEREQNAADKAAAKALEKEEAQRLAELAVETPEAKALFEQCKAIIQGEKGVVNHLIAASAACPNVLGFNLLWTKTYAQWQENKDDKGNDQPLTVPSTIRRYKSLIKWAFENGELRIKSGANKGQLRGISAIEKAKPKQSESTDKEASKASTSGNASASAPAPDVATPDSVEVPKELLPVVGRFEEIKRLIDEQVEAMIQTGGHGVKDDLILFAGALDNVIADHAQGAPIISDSDLVDLEAEEADIAARIAERFEA